MQSHRMHSLLNILAHQNLCHKHMVYGRKPLASNALLGYNTLTQLMAQCFQVLRTLLRFQSGVLFGLPN
jgi:hypothetical protein